MTAPLTRLLVVVGLAWAAVTISGCDAIQRNPKSVYLVGDSILASAYWFYEEPVGRALAPTPDHAVKLEAAARNTAADHLAQVVAYAEVNRPERLVVELGTNDGRTGRWTAEVADTYQAILDAVPERTCVVAVVPAVAPSFDNAEERSDIERAAADIRERVGLLPRHEILEMSDFIDDHPGLIDPDGIHLAHHPGVGIATDVARLVYVDWLRSGIVECQPGS